MGSEIFWATFSVRLYSFFSFATEQCLIFLLQDNEKKREKFLTAKYGAHQVGLVSDQMLPEKTDQIQSKPKVQARKLVQVDALDLSLSL